MTRPIPMVDDLALDAVAWIRQRTVHRTAGVAVADLAGDVQQGLGRGSYEVEVAGVLVGDAREQLEQLQTKAASGTEVPFTADIATALEVEHVVLVEAEFLESAGRPDRYEYRLLLRESPPLPPPAELDPFGGLEGFGDLGFDDLGGVLGDIADTAAAAQSALDAVNEAVNQLGALTALADLPTGNPLGPIQEETGKLSAAGDVAGAVTALADLLGTDG